MNLNFIGINPLNLSWIGLLLTNLTSVHIISSKSSLLSIVSAEVRCSPRFEYGNIINSGGHHCPELITNLFSLYTYYIYI